MVHDPQSAIPTSPVIPIFTLVSGSKVLSEPLKQGHRAKTHPVLGAPNSGSCLAHPTGPFDNLTDPMVGNQ